MTNMKRKKIALIVPSLKKEGPVIVAFEIARSIKDHEIDILYLSNKRTTFSENYNSEINIKKFQVNSIKQYEIFHSHGLRPDLLTALLKLILPHKTSISTLHNFVYEDLGLIYPSLLSKFISNLWIFFNKNKDLLVVLTNHQKNYYKRFYPKKQIKVIGNGRTRNHRKPRNDLKKHIQDFIRSLSNNTFLLGVTCKLIPRKGVHQIIKVLDELTDCALIVVGDGNERDNLEQLSKDLGVSKRILFTGHFDDNSDFFRFIDLFVLPSYSEAFPLALIEASMAGIPSVVSNISTLKGILPSNLIRYFELDNRDSLIHNIKSAQQNLTNVKSEIIQYSELHLTSETMAEKYSSIYEQL